MITAIIQYENPNYGLNTNLLDGNVVNNVITSGVGTPVINPASTPSNIILKDFLSTPSNQLVDTGSALSFITTLQGAYDESVAQGHETKLIVKKTGDSDDFLQVANFNRAQGNIFGVYNNTDAVNTSGLYGDRYFVVTNRSAGSSDHIGVTINDSRNTNGLATSFLGVGGTPSRNNTSQAFDLMLFSWNKDKNGATDYRSTNLPTDCPLDAFDRSFTVGACAGLAIANIYPDPLGRNNSPYYQFTDVTGPSPGMYRIYPSPAVSVTINNLADDVILHTIPGSQFWSANRFRTEMVLAKRPNLSGGYADVITVRLTFALICNGTNLPVLSSQQVSTESRLLASGSSYDFYAEAVATRGVRIRMVCTIKGSPAPEVWDCNATYHNILSMQQHETP